MKNIYLAMLTVLLLAALLFGQQTEQPTSRPRVVSEEVLLVTNLEHKLTDMEIRAEIKEIYLCNVKESFASLEKALSQKKSKKVIGIHFFRMSNDLTTFTEARIEESKALKELKTFFGTALVDLHIKDIPRLGSRIVMLEKRLQELDKLPNFTEVFKKVGELFKGDLLPAEKDSQPEPDQEPPIRVA